MQQSSEHQGLYLEKVDCNDLRAGMYVQELDRPWLETPFMFQGFYIKSSDEIALLKKYCSYVYINTDKLDFDPEGSGHQLQSEQSTETRVRDIASQSSGVARYPDTVEVVQELETARRVYEESSSAIQRIFDSVQGDAGINLPEVITLTTDIVGSVLRNPDAFMLLQRMKTTGRYRYIHAINCCALAATFCRHLGFTRAEIQDISMGALLLDIGMSRLPDSMVDLPGPFNPLVMKLMRHHVQLGLEILEKTPNLPVVVRDMLCTHHERINGRGYPSALQGEQIPVCGRIAAIVDCYDAMISNRPYKHRITPTVAVCSMYNWRNIDFHEDLIEQFIQCIGAYPTGTLVQLSSGQIGIVMSQNRVRRLYPKILLILSADGEEYQPPVMLDLWDYATKTKGAKLEICRVVDAEEMGVDPASYYL
jgi:HD-GYP domain-containing protein (c-di-GMP phosphodiesterase class II)